MTITTTNYKRCDVVKMTGRIDSQTASDLRSAFEGLTEDSRFKIVFDMSEVEFMSSGGIWVLLDTQKTCKRWNRGELVIAEVHDEIKKTLDLAGIQHFFKIYDNVLDAVGSF